MPQSPLTTIREKRLKKQGGKGQGRWQGQGSCD